MKTSGRRRSRIALTLGAALAALALGTVARADDISNGVDASVDAVAEVMPLQVGGSNGTQIFRRATNGDGKNGCNLTGSSTLVLHVVERHGSRDRYPSSVTFTSCGSEDR